MKPDPFQTRRDYAGVPVRFPADGMDGGSFRILYATQDDADNDATGNPVPLFFSSLVTATTPFKAVKNADGTGDLLDVYWEYTFTGVLFTGQVFFAQKMQPPVSSAASGGSAWQVVQDGVSAWYGVNPDGNIIAGAGYALLPYWRFCPGETASLDYCRVEVTAGDTAFNVSADDGQLCDIAFDQATGTFVVTRAYCPGVA